MRSRWLSRAGTWLLAFLVGAVYSLAGTIAHAYMLGWFPLGLVLAIIGSAALLISVRALTSDRWATLATGIGMMTTLLVISGRGPGGSVVVPQEGPGTVVDHRARPVRHGGGRVARHVPHPASPRTRRHGIGRTPGARLCCPPRDVD